MTLSLPFVVVVYVVCENGSEHFSVRAGSHTKLAESVEISRISSMCESRIFILTSVGAVEFVTLKIYTFRNYKSCFVLFKNSL